MKKVTIEELRRIREELNQNSVTMVSGCYIFVIHPDVARDLVEMRVRARWKAEWRRVRLARKGKIESRSEVEIGVWESFRYIRS